MSGYRVFILEDHPATRAQLVAAVAGDSRLALAGQAGSLADARQWFADDGDAQAALIDLGLPDGNGVELIREINAMNPGPHVLVITVFGDEKSVISAIAAGATGYLLKEREPQHITDSICEVLNGDSPISPSIARHLLKRFRTNENDRPSSDVVLTTREIDVLKLVVKGFSYREIADNLDLSVHTVTSHIQHIYRKLSVGSRGEAVFEAIQLGLVDIR